MATPRDRADELCAFLDEGASPYHAVAAAARRLEAAGFRRLDERDRWAVEPGTAAYVVRDGSSIAAFRVGRAPIADAGFRIVGAHTDSPTFKVRPRADVRRAGYRLLGVEPYGGLLAHTWFDRDLTLAGRVALVCDDGSVELRLARLPGAPLRIPSLAIHLAREIREEGFRPNLQQHTAPLWAADVEGEPGLVAALAELCGVDADAVLGWDLVTTDTQPSAVGGRDEAWVYGPRMDNLVSVHLGLEALLAVDAAAPTQVLVANDHEEVGSGSAEGAAGSFLEDVLRRLVAATDGAEPEAFLRAVARSRLVSSDMAHAVHPNYADRHEGEHRPALAGGPVLKVNANQSYTTDAGTGAWFIQRCRDAGSHVQHFVTRADLPCGSTIGPITAARLGLPTVDVGNPMLSMHSCREQCAVADLTPMMRALAACYTADA